MKSKFSKVWGLGLVIIVFGLIMWVGAAQEKSLLSSSATSTLSAVEQVEKLTIAEIGKRVGLTSKQIEQAEINCKNHPDWSRNDCILSYGLTQKELDQVVILHKAHVNWTIQDCIGVSHKSVWIGMSYDILVASYGSEPNSANPSNYGSGIKWQWCWFNRTPSCFYDDNGDKLIDSYN